MDLGQSERILVLQTSFLGDSVLSLPLMAEIRRRFPQAKLTLLCTPAGKELLRDHSGLDAILVDDKHGVDRGWRGLIRKARELRSREFSAALTPHKSFRSALLLFL